MSDDHQLASEGNDHKFCYLYWEHGPGSQTSLYYLDIPKRLNTKTRAHSIFRPQDTDHRNFVKQLNLHGWQTYHMQANQEVYEIYLIRTPELALDKSHEYGVFHASVFADASRPATELSLFGLGENNISLLPSSMWNSKYEDVIQFLDKEHWKFSHIEDYPQFEDLPNVRRQLRFYKRPLA